MKPIHVRESLIPGLGHIRRGFRSTGARFLLYTVLWITVLALRFRAIPKLFADLGFAHVFTILVMFGLPVALVWFAHKSLQGLVNPPSKDGMGTWQLAWRSIRKNPRGMWGLTLLGILYFLAAIAPLLAPFDPERETQNDSVVTKFIKPMGRVFVFGTHSGSAREYLAQGFEVEGDKLLLWRGTWAPEQTRQKRIPLSQLCYVDAENEDHRAPRRGWPRDDASFRTLETPEGPVSYYVNRHILGTDEKGRDLLSRLVHGSQISLTIGLLAMVVAVSLGTLFGALAGFFGGWTDNIIMRIVDILLAFPRLLLLLLIVSAYEDAGIFVVVAILGATGWMGVSRLVRAQFLQVRALDYAAAAQSLGLGRARIMFRHLLPNCMAPVIVNATLLVGSTILVEAGLSFLGFGVRPPTPSWGNIISDGRSALEDAWWISTIPGLLIVWAVVCINLAGDALRDALDPRQR